MSSITPIDPLIQHIIHKDPKLYEALKRITDGLLKLDAINSKQISGGVGAASDFKVNSVIVPTPPNLIDNTGIRFVVAGSTIQPFVNPVELLYEDFDSGNLLDNGIGTLRWSVSPFVAAISYEDVSGRPGVFRIESNGTTLLGISMTSPSGAAFSRFHFEDNFELLWDCRPKERGTLSNTILRIGMTLSNAFTANPPITGMWFEKLAADTNWFAVFRKTSVQTRQDTGIAVASNVWQQLKLKRTGASTVDFNIDGTSFFPTYSNVPTYSGSEGLFVFMQIKSGSAEVQGIDFDRFYMLINNPSRPALSIGV